MQQVTGTKNKTRFHSTWHSERYPNDLEFVEAAIVLAVEGAVDEVSLTEDLGVPMVRLAVIDGDIDWAEQLRLGGVLRDAVGGPVWIGQATPKAIQYYVPTAIRDKKVPEDELHLYGTPLDGRH